MDYRILDSDIFSKIERGVREIGWVSRIAFIEQNSRYRHRGNLVSYKYYMVYGKSGREYKLVVSVVLREGLARGDIYKKIYSASLGEGVELQYIELSGTGNSVKDFGKVESEFIDKLLRLIEVVDRV